jgi:hypothetical protein
VPYPDNPQTLNRYVYVANNPLKYVDPSGRLFWLAALAIGAVLGGTISAIQGQPFWKGALIGAVGGFVGWAAGSVLTPILQGTFGQTMGAFLANTTAGALAGAAAGATSAALYGGNFGAAIGFGALFGAASGALFGQLPSTAKGGEPYSLFEKYVWANVVKGMNWLTNTLMTVWQETKAILNAATVGLFNAAYEVFQFGWQSVNNLVAFAARKLTNAQFVETIEGVNLYEGDLSATAITFARRNVIFQRGLTTDLRAALRGSLRETLRHELGHTFQAELLGPAYLPVYLGLSAVSALAGAYPHAVGSVLSPQSRFRDFIGGVASSSYSLHPMEFLLVPVPPWP